MGKLEGFNERRSEGSMFSTTFFNKIKEKVSALKENFLENEDLRPSQTLDAGVQGLKAGIQAIEEADRDGLIGDHLTEEQKYALNQIAIQGDNVEPDVDEQGKLTLSFILLKKVVENMLPSLLLSLNPSNLPMLLLLLIFVVFVFKIFCFHCFCKLFISHIRVFLCLF